MAQEFGDGLSEDGFSTTLRELEMEFENFLVELKEFRATLGEEHQRLLDAMFYAALGRYQERDDDVAAYWTVDAPVITTEEWPALPWGVAYRTYYRSDTPSQP